MSYGSNLCEIHLFSWERMVKLNALVMFYVYNLLIGPRPLQKKGPADRVGRGDDISYLV